MKVLTLDTAQWISSIALWQDGKELGYEDYKKELIAECKYRQQR